ncbi:sugar transporter [Gluconacetobacter diazotrophicus PA1 5]|uniref:sugar porter family MFS transporter n=1 Tax=Gluconacetobacter diazotrophicus TaxID=33996 RepID=UPI000173DB58|nr:sugar porter family MFS transporter [Gluconacetobacter diazotrophicus]ACI50184.1 sugar transporter [Gluconacetobacter diazotrophicus PA1 5]TWB08060.1 SP family galactose:H+ symporter-like MFS transporter [Gluconacetobacter diazotrophicus]
MEAYGYAATTGSRHLRKAVPGRAGLVAGLAAVAGLMFGLDIGVISGALSLIAQEFDATQFQQEAIVAAMMLGAAVGVPIAGWLSFDLGRKRTLVIGASLFIVGSTACALSGSVGMLIAARIVLGLAIGISTFTAPLYIAEIADAANRGAMVSIYQLMVTIGILTAFVSDALFAYFDAWRWMLGIVAFPGIVFLIGVAFLPASPRWLMLRGRRDEARRALLELRGQAHGVARELSEIDAQLRTQGRGWALFRSNRNFRRAVFLGVMLQCVQQFTGMNVVMYYAPRIFGLAGFAEHARLWGTATVGGVNMAATFMAIWLVDRWGRRPILICGLMVMSVGMAGLGLMLREGMGQGADQTMAVALLLCFVAGFAFSAGPLVWVLCSEIQPLQGRDFGIACSTATNWISNMIVGVSFLTLLDRLGRPETFWLYAGLNALFVVLVALFVPETKGLSLERIERDLMGGVRLRDIGRRRP